MNDRADRSARKKLCTERVAAMIVTRAILRRVDDRVGLCASCRFVDVIASSKASIFYRCRLSDTDPSFRRYPVLPVIACRGYQRALDDR